MTKLEIIGEVIHAVARREDSELRRFSGKGILSMPELAFVHSVAKELSSRASEIFEVLSIGWQMNKNVGAGLTDLVIDPRSDKHRKVAIEFKIGGKVENWSRDIEKLSKLATEGYDSIFCALADVFTHDLTQHGRFKVLDDDARTERVVKTFEFFTTRSDFATHTCCVVGLWQVKAAPQ